MSHGLPINGDVLVHVCSRARAESRSDFMVARRCLDSTHRAKTSLRSCDWHKHREKNREHSVNVSIKSWTYAVESVIQSCWSFSS